MYKSRLSFAILLLLPCASAYAYIGPGLGAGGLAVVLGILSSVLFAIVGLLWYPIKRVLISLRERKRHSKRRRDGSTLPAAGK